MDQLICSSLFHTHYWYEVGMLKVPAEDGRVFEELRDVSQGNPLKLIAFVQDVCVWEQSRRRSYAYYTRDKSFEVPLSSVLL